jgi:hypothetical protein
MINGANIAKRAGAMQKVAAAFARSRVIEPPPVDPEYLHRLAERLALAARISPEVARRRVQALAISARPRERNHGFEDRCR